MNSSSSSSSSGIGVIGLLTVLFIALKLIGVIDWSWFWVLFLPILGGIVLIGIILIIVYLIVKIFF